MILEKLYLIDRNETLVDAWKQCFKQFNEVEVLHGDYFQKSTDAIVSPANSYGIMDGGIDIPLNHKLGRTTVKNLQSKIVENFHGEMPVGCALIIETENSSWPWLVSAPTMRIPEDVSNTINCYHAFRAALMAVKYHNQISERKIKTMACCGMATGYGKMPYRRCASQMLMAFNQVNSPAKILSVKELHLTHKKIRE